MKRQVAPLVLTVVAAAGIFASERYDPPAAPSNECVSCHATAANHGNHPTGVSYAERHGVNRTLRPAAASSGFGSTIANDLLVAGRVECSSCHVTHEEETVMPFRLRTRTVLDVGTFDYRSEYIALCTSCHQLD